MNKKQIVLTVLTLVCICAIAVTGSLAYLTATSNDVKNTFVFGDNLVGDMDIVEHTIEDPDGDNVFTLTDTTTTTGNAYTVYPGVDLPKDPVVSITTKTKTDAYLFIKVDYSAFDKTFLSYTVDTANWTLVQDVTSKKYAIYVYKNGAILDENFGTSGTGTVSILANNKITVSKDATAIADGCALSFSAYLAQASAATTGSTAIAKAKSAFMNCFTGVIPTT